MAFFEAKCAPKHEFCLRSNKNCGLVCDGGKVLQMWTMMGNRRLEA
jgi:hypothetical protein